MSDVCRWGGGGCTYCCGQHGAPLVVEIPGSASLQVWLQDFGWSGCPVAGWQQKVNIKAYDNSMPVRESSRKLWNQECFTLTFPKPPQPGRKKRSRPSELQITVPRDSKKNTRPHETIIESKKTGNDKKSKIGDKEDKTPSKSSHESELSKKSKYKSGTNPKSKDSQTVLMMHPKNSRALKNSKDTDIEPICTKKGSKSSKNNSNAKSEACSKNSSNMDLMLYLQKSGTESMEFDMWLKNYSQNNSKKSSKKEAKSSDAESSDSKGSKKDKKSAKKTKKKKAKDTESTDAESGSELESKKSKEESKKSKKASKKDDKKKDSKKEALSTDNYPESERILIKVEKVETINKKGPKKSDKKESPMKAEESTGTESDLESKKDKKHAKKAKRTSKKDLKRKDTVKNVEYTGAESNVPFKKDTRKPGISKSSDAESEESMYKAGAKKREVDESDATSTESKKEALETKRSVKMSLKKTTFKGRGTSTVTGRIPPSRESSLPSFCEPFQLSPKIKHRCQCKMDPPQPKPRYAPLLFLALGITKDSGIGDKVNDHSNYFLLKGGDEKGGSVSRVFTIFPKGFIGVARTEKFSLYQSEVLATLV
ncbi:PREDICTED: cylicin-1 [Myotis brandtii]|uniref:cylicin-1 n=1 Tax=Myotis brandtii TaxID=109478 RepID=UPI0007041953|nr:PREDICTED: cylicin-1 [Myotis brandtii]